GARAGWADWWGGAGSGAGVRFARGGLARAGAWQDEVLAPPQGQYAWRGWRALWHAQPGEHELACRATDGNGDSQPLCQRWDSGGFGNNAVQRVQVTVR